MSQSVPDATDVFVIGGGPAGLAAAIAARERGCRVLVADGAEPPIDKACGEGLLPDGRAAAAAVAYCSPSAARPSGSKPSPQALSIGGSAPSATRTRNPRSVPRSPPRVPQGRPQSQKRRSRLHALIHASDPPSDLNVFDSTTEQYQLRTKSRTHGRQHAQRAWLRTAVPHHIFQHHQHGSRRKVPDFLQAIPGCVELSVVQIERVCCCLQHLRPARVQHPASNVAALDVRGRPGMHPRRAPDVRESAPALPATA